MISLLKNYVAYLTAKNVTDLLRLAFSMYMLMIFRSQKLYQ